MLLLQPQQLQKKKSSRGTSLRISNKSSNVKFGRKRKRSKDVATRSALYNPILKASTFQDIESWLKGQDFIDKNVRPNVSISRQILHIFQSSSRKFHSELMNELLSYKIAVSTSTEVEQIMIALVQFMTPRDQSSLIRILRKSEMYHDILDFLNYLNGSHADQVYSYTTAILALSASTDLKHKIVKLLIDMEEKKNIIPNTYTYTAAFLAIDKAEESFALLSRARERGKSQPDLVSVHLYDAAIHACSRDRTNGYSYAISIFRQMPRDNIKPNTKTFASLLHACAQSNKFKIAFAIFDEMKNTPGIDMSHVDKVWLAALEACALAKNGSKALEVLGQMLTDCKSSFEPTLQHFNIVLSALAKEGRYLAACELLNHMHDGTLNVLFPESVSVRKCMVDLVSINTTLSSFALLKRFDEARILFGSLKNGDFKSIDDSGMVTVLKPDIISYNTFLCSCNNSEYARSILVEVR